MRITLSILLLAPLFIFSQNEKNVTEYAKSITPNELKELLYVYASDYFEGRETGTRGQKKAVDFIRQFYSSHAINAAQGTEDYFQPMELNIKGKMVKTENVAAIIEGSEFPDEYIVISSHLDHVGIQNGMIHNGADDDGSGTVAAMEIAEAFMLAKKAGQGPRRSVLVMAVSGEEKGLLGSKYYTDHPIYPLEKTVANLNIDMIGRIGDFKDNPNYVYLIGADRLSQELHDISEQVNKEHIGLELDYTFNEEDDPNRYYYRSDHYNFAKNNIPVIFYFNGIHEDYHKVTDTVEKIDFQKIETITRLVFLTAWELANRDERIVVDKIKN